MIVAVNPGHSDSDPGAIGPTGLTEAAVTLHVAHALLPRGDDGVRYVGRRQKPGRLGRWRLCRSLRSDHPELVLSLHCDWHDYPKIGCLHEARIFYREDDPETGRRAQSARLAEAVVARAQVTPRFAERAVVKTAPYARKTRLGTRQYTPGILIDTARLAIVLVEMGFITDPHVEEAMRTTAWVRRAAASLDGAVRDWLCFAR